MIPEYTSEHASNYQAHHLNDMNDMKFDTSWDRDGTMPTVTEEIKITRGFFGNKKIVRRPRNKTTRR
jgi:hypothetical protein